MDNLLDIIQADALSDEIDMSNMLNADYQANMYTIEEALRETGALKSSAPYTRSPYDEAIMRLINSVPMR